jgi:hypothetical protein
MAPAAAVMCIPGMSCSTFIACVGRLEAGGKAKVPSRREKRRTQVELGQLWLRDSGRRLGTALASEPAASALAVVA